MGSNREKSFNFTWIIENYSWLWMKKGEHIASAPFIVETIEKTKWRVKFFPAGNNCEGYVDIYLERQEDCEGPSAIEIEYEFSLSVGEDSLFEAWVLLHSFPKGESCGFIKFQEKENIFLEKGVNTLPQDTLTICCKMWKPVGCMEERVECVARTRIGIERKSFDWVVHPFSILSKNNNTYNIRSVSEDELILSMNLFIEDKGIISLKITNVCENLRVFHSDFWILDDSGTPKKHGSIKYSFSDTLYKLHFPFHFTKDELIAAKNFSSEDDVLTLRCECAFSTGITFNGIESIVYGCGTPSMNSELPDTLPNIVVRNLKLLLREKLFCDTKLKTKTRCLPAHKIILSACSPVFKALFTKETVDECVDVEDLDDDAVERMLQYAYLGELGGLEWENACKLYDIAAKYEILPLKEECSSFLKGDLSPSKVCEALIHADKNKDDDLKKVVQNFIVEHGEDIINSDAWKQLMRTHLQLAADTMILKFI